MPKSLAEIALEEGLATAASVERAAEVSDRDAAPLVVALVRECGIDEVALVAAIRRHVRLAVGDPANVAPEPDALREIARDVCQRLRVVPLAISSYDGRRRVLRLAMADPTDTVAVAEIEHLSGCRIEPVLMTLSAVEELADRCYRHFVTEVMRRDPRGGAVPTAPPSTVPQPLGKSGRGATIPGAGGETAAASQNTVPYHRLSDEADVETLVRALAHLLVQKRVLEEEELEEVVRQLMRRRDDGA